MFPREMRGRNMRLFIKSCIAMSTYGQWQGGNVGKLAVPRLGAVNTMRLVHRFEQLVRRFDRLCTAEEEIAAGVQGVMKNIEYRLL